MTAELDLTPMPSFLIFKGTDQTLRKERVRVTAHRTWTIVPRYGTASSDRWTVIGSPIPASDNPCRDYEDGQFPDLATAYDVLETCVKLDDGTHEED